MTSKKTTHDAIAEKLVRPYVEPARRTAPSTHEQHAQTLTQQWKAPVKNEEPTTHEQTAERFTDQFRESDTVAQLAELLTTSSELERQAVQSALAGDNK